MDNLQIPPQEDFPHLSRAPVTEAVLEIRGNAVGDWEEKEVSRQWKKNLPDYPLVSPERQLRAKFSLNEGGSGIGQTEDLGWSGITLKNSEGNQVVRSTKHTFAFSRLKPYTDWGSFLEEGLRAWEIHKSLAQPNEFSRVGLRFINRFPLPEPQAELADYLNAPPKEPDGLPLLHTGFLHKDVLVVPDRKFGIQLIKTVIPAQKGDAHNLDLIVDIDVHTINPLPVVDRRELEDLLWEMRCWKNKVFFGSITKKVLKTLL